MSVISIFFNKTPPNPFEELHIGLQMGIRNLFPVAELFIQALTLDPPPPHIDADYTFSTFSLSMIIDEDPTTIAAQIVDYFTKIQLPLVDSIFSVGPYVNIEVNKTIFNGQALNHITGKGRFFGATKSQHPKHIFINYHVSDFLASFSTEGLRQLLIGRVVAACNKLVGHRVRHTYYIADWDMHTLGFLYALKKWPNEIDKLNDPLNILRAATTLLKKKILANEAIKAHLKIFFHDLKAGDKRLIKLFKYWRRTLLDQIQQLHSTLGSDISCYMTESDFINASKDVIAVAIQNGVVNRQSGTNTVITLHVEGATSLVLQKHDGSTTSLVRHIASLRRKCISNLEPTKLINICTTREAEMTQDILNIARRINYISTKTQISVIVVNRADDPKSHSITDKALHYGLLRMPPNRKATVKDNEGAIQYAKIVRLKDQSCKEKMILSKDDIFRITKLLISFPYIINKVQRTDAPDQLCYYLEEVANQCETLPIQNDHELVRATAIVVKNGLSLLTF